MIPGLNIYNGLMLYESISALEQTDKPLKIHKKKSWMRKNYHKRIQKKWLKRWGFFWKPAIFITQTAVFVHPALMPMVKKELEEQRKNALLSNPVASY